MNAEHDLNEGGEGGPGPVSFGPVGGFDTPSLPAQTAAFSLVARVRRVLAGSDDEAPYISEDKLQSAADGSADEAAPACEPVVKGLDAALSAWINDPSTSRAARLVVTPPCDRSGTLETWASRRGLELLPPPQPDALVTGGPVQTPSLAGEGVLVIPRLEDWFLRHRSGLARVRALLVAVGKLERRCLIGCGSWAWAFLSKAVEADAWLPRPLTFEPLDGPRLHAWFHDIARGTGRGADGSGAGHTRFLLARTGDEVFPSDEGDAPGLFFKRLAAESRGIPWVAWWVWRESLRVEEAEEGDGGDAGGEAEGGEGEAGGGDDPMNAQEQAAVEAAARGRGSAPAEVYVRSPEEVVVPDRHAPDELLVLQALLIHDGLTPERLFDVVPTMRDRSILQALLQAGLVERCDETIRCRPAAYPAIRSGLVAAGFPGDGL